MLSVARAWHQSYNRLQERYTRCVRIYVEAYSQIHNDDMKVGLSENLLCLFCVFANFWFIHNRITVCSSLNKKCDPALYILVIAYIYIYVYIYILAFGCEIIDLNDAKQGCNREYACSEGEKLYSQHFMQWFFCPNSPQRLGARQRIYLTPGPHPRPIFIRRRRPQRFVIATHFRAS